MGCSTVSSPKSIEARKNSWILLASIEPQDIKKISICKAKNGKTFILDENDEKEIYSTKNIDDFYLISNGLFCHLKRSQGIDKWGNRLIYGCGCAGVLYTIKIKLSDYEYTIFAEHPGFSFGDKSIPFYSYPLAYWLNDKVLKATGQKPSEFFVRCLSGEYELERGRKYWLRFKKEEENRSKNLIPTKK